MLLIRLLAVLMIAAAGNVCCATEVRIKDLAEFSGANENPLTGFGLVVGLNGTGGKAPITRRFAMNFIQQNGISVPPAIRDQIRTDTRELTPNMSVVVVTAHLPPFHRKGQKIKDVTVSTFDDAKSLTGGILLMTPLLGVDGKVYATADGPVSVDSFVAGGEAATVQKNHPTSGRLASGAILVEEVCTTIVHEGRARLLLRQPDFETAVRMVDVINAWQPGCSRALDPGTVEIDIVGPYANNLSMFLAQVEALKVQPDVRARVVINERTGTIVIGENVRLSKALITHANLAIFTKESPEVSQPAPFSDGETTVVPRTDVDAIEEDGTIHVVEETPTVGDLARALNALGVAPRDLGVIFQQLRDAGALHADLEYK